MNIITLQANMVVPLCLMLVILVMQTSFTSAQESMKEADEIFLPTMHAYYGKGSIPKYDDRLVHIWSMYWKNRGWNTKILNLNDAKKHLLFEEFNESLKEADIRWIPKQSFLRHIAMSTVEKGGFFSELYLFPLRRASNMTLNYINDQYVLPNEGNFTCYDSTCSLLSGSYEEWNRITNLLLKNMDKNAFWTLRKIRRSNPSLIYRQFITYAVEWDSSGKEFDMDICDHLKTKSVARFNIKKISYPTSSILTWFKISKVRCLSNRPIMFTFFQPQEKFRNEDRILLEFWKETWSGTSPCQ